MEGNRTRQFSCLLTLLRFLKSNCKESKLLYYTIKSVVIRFYLMQVNVSEDLNRQQSINSIFKIHYEMHF